MRTISPALFFPLLAPWRESGFVLGRDGSLTAVLRNDGRDPDGLDDEDFAATSMVFRAALCSAPVGMRVQQFYIHTPAPVPTMRPRGHDIIDMLTASRHEHMSRKTLYSTRLYTALSLDVGALASKVGLIQLITLLMSAPVDAEARKRIRQIFSRKSDLTFIVSAIDSAAVKLGDAVESVKRRMGIYADSSVAGLGETWQLARFLSTFDESLWNRNDPPPDDHWYAHMLHSRAYGCQVQGSEYLRVEAPARYVRAASIVRQKDRVEPGFWAKTQPTALSVAGSFVIATNALPLSGALQSMRFAGLKNELSRRKFNVVRALADRDGATRDLTARESSPEEKEIDAAEGLDDVWYDCQVSAFAIGATAAEAKRVENSLDHSFSQSRLLPVWETPGLEMTYRALQLGAMPFKPRALLLNATQIGAAGLHYRYSQGSARVEDLGGEEPLIYLETIDGQPFGFSPFVGGKSTVLGTGSSRSGKTFAKNVLGAIWPKYGGQLVTLDYDQGSDALAQLYGKDAAAFAQTGMNPFRAQGMDVNAFKAHMSRLAAAIMMSNDDPSLRTLAAGEQRLLDQATEDTLRLPQSLQSLSNWASHLPPDTAAKVARWVKPVGRYAAFLDNVEDDVGLIERMVTVFNLAAVRDDNAARPPVLEELLWRITLAFEDPNRLDVPKKLSGDEAHYLLRDRSLAQLLVTKARTWAKYRASLELWTHIPENYGDAPDWGALRSSASTFLFTATPDADADQYIQIFGITKGDVETIRNMTPKRDLYLIQPDIGLRKRLVLDADPQSLVWASSSPDIVSQRNQLAEQHGIIHAIQSLARAK